MRFSFAARPADDLAALIGSAGATWEVTDDAAFDGAATGRIRYLGGRPLTALLGTDIDATVHPGPPLPGLAGLLPTCGSSPCV
ncbi:hypothetical protein [Tessaracoccus coleopterorum]|uniref:hypothetical protein n=1 Tax=Tessaracoccus coleopterorum TaxID=2714950 RepID=UPI0018D2BCF3|nr:hypothetical protein [Tessaracoccus coleopterorum]